MIFVLVVWAVQESVTVHATGSKLRGFGSIYWET